MYNAVESAPHILYLRVVDKVEVRFRVFDTAVFKYVHNGHGDKRADTSVCVFRINAYQPEIDDLRLLYRFEQARKRRFGGEPIPAPAHGSGELQRIEQKDDAGGMMARSLRLSAVAVSFVSSYRKSEVMVIVAFTDDI